MLDHGRAGNGGVTAAVAATVATVALVTLLAGAASASGACGGVEQEKPRKDVGLGRAPLVIGDSPLLLALPNLAAEGYRANARGCRQYPEGLALLRELRRRDKLPRLVVIALGSNGSISKEDIHDALHIVGKKRILGLATPRELGGGAGHDAALVRREAHKHKRVRLLDWVRFSSGHAGWFQPDGLHLTFSGAAALARLFDDLLKLLPPPR
jgi:lysophospholipase L1-like esterase